MLINLTDVLSCEDKVVKRTADIELETFVSALGSFPITDKEPMELTITNLGEDKLLIEGGTKLTVWIPCDRCLTDVATPLTLKVSKEVDMKQSAEGRIKDMDETEFIIGYNLDVERLIHGEILLAWPMKTLCREDCQGICPKCGKDLNQGTCDCDRVELDPRMAVIAEIFKNCN